MSSSDSFTALRRLIVGYRLSQALSAVARLGIADLLKDGPKHADELARETGTHAPSLYRVLRLLASEGIFAEQKRGHFALTALAEPLLSDAPRSLRARAIFEGEPWNWGPWSNLLHSVRTGGSAFDHMFGMGLFDYLEQHVDASASFNRLMAEQTTAQARDILQVYDFAGVDILVDVGGGHGALLAAVLRARPGMRGILFDLPQATARARTELEAAGVADRCEIVEGDFFETVPEGGEAYLLKYILHDWDDEQCQKILGNCRRAMARGARLVVVESLIPPGNEPHYGKYLDVSMLVITKGRERTEQEYGSLFRETGFTPSRMVPTRAELSVIEAIAA